MTFLEPLLLWGLPLISVPIVIHLMNRMRHKPKKWAAMEFLFMAKRSSTKISHLRNLFILICRCLVLLFLFLALARPLAGSFLGWSVTSPDTIFILLDRSASMGATSVGAEKTRLKKGIENIVQAAASIPGNPRFVFIDSTNNKARTIGDIEQLSDELIFGSTQTATDITEMLNSTLKYAIDNKTGISEVWLVSDMQSSNWKPRSATWQKLMSQFNGLDQKTGFKVLSLTGDTEYNASITLLEKFRKKTPQGSELQLVFEIKESDADTREIPLTFSVDGFESSQSFTVEGQSLTVQHTLPLDKKLNGKSGNGFIKLADDGNNNDNIAYFAFDPAPKLKAALAVADKNRGEFLEIAAAPAPDIFQQQAETIKNESISRKKLQETSLVILDGYELTDSSKQDIQEFIEEGGNVLLFPSGKEGDSFIGNISFGEVSKSDKKAPYRIARWEENLGPLTRSPSGTSLPMKNIQVLQRQTATGDGQVLASYEDGTGFLTRYNIGRGQLYYCSTLVEKGWSNLVKGSVLVPMLHRLQEEGSRRLSSIQETSCGDYKAIAGAKSISDGSESALNGNFPGIFIKSGNLVVLNRAESEDINGTVTQEELTTIFGSVSMNLQEAVQREDDDFKTKLWTPFMAILFIFFLVEGWLTMRQKPTQIDTLPEVRI
jgi:hypothetical protein